MHVGHHFQVSFPACTTKFVYGKPRYNGILTVDHPIKSPAHNTDVISTRTCERQIIGTVAIVSVNGVVPLVIFLLCTYTIDDLTIFLLTNMALDGQAIIKPNGRGRYKTHLFLVVPGSCLDVVRSPRWRLELESGFAKPTMTN